MLGLANRLPLNFDSLGLTLNRIEGFFSEILGSAIAARIILSAPASPAARLRVTRGGIAQERALISALTSLAALFGVLSGVFSKLFSETRAVLGLSTGNTSAAYVFSDAFSETGDVWLSNSDLGLGLGLPGLLISGDSGAEEVALEDTDGRSD